MNIKKIFISILSTILLCGTISCCGQSTTTTSKTNNDKKSIFVYCAAGLKKPMDDIGKVFEEKNGVKIEYTYGNSSQLIGQMELSHKGDVCLLATNEDYEIAKQKSLVEAKKDLVYHIPVIAVPKGNPTGIKTIQDLGKPGIKLVLGDEKSSPLGKLSSKLFEKTGIGDAAKQNVVSTAPTVNELVTYLSMKKADASIIWEDNVVNAKDIDVIQIPKEQNIIKVVPISALKSGANKDLTEKFLTFTASDEGKSIFKKYGLKPVK